MSPLPSPVALNHISPLSHAEAVPDAPGSTSEITPDLANPGVRPSLLAGCLTAAAFTLLFCRPPQPHTLTWTTILVRSTGYIALAAITGAMGTAISRLFLKTKPPFALLLRSAAPAWIFFPCILLFYLRQAPWLYLAIALATIVSAVNLRRIFPVHAETDQLPHSTSVLPSIYGLPIARFRPFRAAVIAISAQAALFCAAADRLIPAGVLIAASLFLFTWRWSAFDTSLTLTGKRPSSLLGGVALSFTVLALLPWLSAKPHNLLGPSIQFHRPSRLAQRPVEPDPPNAEYVGIVLWPPPKKKTEIVPPTPRVHSFAIGRAAKPVVIPFDGPYWYFKSPSIRPGLRAHIAHGNATDVTIRSSDWWPLLMQAHQNLGLPIDLNCCSEIDVAITNADTRPGVITLALRLTDSLSAAKSIQTLPDQTILSTVAAQIPINRPPVKEILRFPIPHAASMRQFNQIDVLYHPARDRARGAARVSIQSFTLIPK
jgi:hypothetical protein